LAAGHFWKAFHLGYDALPDNQLKQRVRWDVYLLMLRALAMFMMAAHGLAFILVPLMALLLSYFEIWPERALGAVFGDPSRLYEYDPDDPASSRRRRRRWRLRRRGALFRKTRASYLDLCEEVFRRTHRVRRSDNSPR